MYVASIVEQLQPEVSRLFPHTTSATSLMTLCLHTTSVISLVTLSPEHNFSHKQGFTG